MSVFPTCARFSAVGIGAGSGVRGCDRSPPARPLAPPPGLISVGRRRDRKRSLCLGERLVARDPPLNCAFVAEAEPRGAGTGPRSARLRGGVPAPGGAGPLALLEARAGAATTPRPLLLRQRLKPWRSWGCGLAAGAGWQRPVPCACACLYRARRAAGKRSGSHVCRARSFNGAARGARAAAAAAGRRPWHGGDKPLTSGQLGSADSGPHRSAGSADWGQPPRPAAGGHLLARP